MRTSNTKWRRGALLLAAVAGCGCADPGGAAEPWADDHLPVKQGLVLWLDASRQNAARQTRQLPVLADGAEPDVWFDGSGRGFHLSQGIATARPRFRTQAGGAAVAFDGKDDFLAVSNLRASLTNATLFIHAAPLSNAGGFRGFLAVNEFIRKGESHDDAIDHANSLHGKEVCRFTTKIVAPQCAALRGDTNTRPVAIGEVIDNEGRVYYVGHYPSREDLRQPARDRW